MPGTLDNILNFIIPLGVFIFLGFSIYKGLQEPIDKFIAWVKGLISPDKEGEEDTNLWPYEIGYY